MSSEINKRVDYIDLIKGLAIILVVYGHVIQFGSGSEVLSSEAFFYDPLFSLIYSFHMPIFMLISGYLFNRSSSESILYVVKKRARSLLLPVAVWQTMFFFLTTSLENIAGQLILKNYISSIVHGLWFLWAVFYCSVATLVIDRISKKWIRNSMFIFIITIAFFTPDNLGAHLYKYMFPYFVLGYYSNYFITLSKWSFSIKYIVIFIFTSIAFLNLLESYDYTSYIYTSKFYVFSGELSAYQHIKVNLFRYSIGIIGSIWFILFLNAINQSKKFMNSTAQTVIVSLGRKSLGIYIISSYLTLMLSNFEIYKGINYAYILVVTLIIIFLSVSVSVSLIKVISVNRKLNLLLLGVVNK